MIMVALIDQIVVLCVVAAAVSVNACSNYTKIVDNACAETCLNSTLGVCPLSIIVKAGGLKSGTCPPLGYTKFNGSLVEKAGPCGKIVFYEYLKQPNDSDHLIVGKPMASKWRTVREATWGGSCASDITILKDMTQWNGTVQMVSTINVPEMCTIATDVSLSTAGTSALRVLARNSQFSKLADFTLHARTSGGTAKGPMLYDTSVKIPANGQWTEVVTAWESFQRVGFPEENLRINSDTITTLAFSTRTSNSVGAFKLDLQAVRTVS